MPSFHVNMFSYYYFPIIRLEGTNLNKMVRLLRYSGLSSQNMYIKKKLYEKVLFLVFFPLIATPKQAQMHTESILKIRKNKTKHVLTVKKAHFLEGIRTERAS